MAVYTDLYNVQQLLSVEGLLYREDDDLDQLPEEINEVRVIDWCIDHASRKVDFYLGQRYDPSGFAANEWVKHATTVLAACAVTLRRGNPIPESLKALCDEWTEMLKQVQDGFAIAPGLIPLNNHPILVSNMVCDLRFRDQPIRRSILRSTGDAPPSNVKSHPVDSLERDDL